MNTDTLPYLLHRTAFLLDRHIDQVLLERLGIGYSQLRLLLVLQERDGIAQGAIASELHQTEASISRQIKLIAEKRLVIVRRSRTNRREHLIFLTGKGEDIAEQAVRYVNDYLQPKVGLMSGKDQEHLRQLLQRLSVLLR